MYSTNTHLQRIRRNVAIFASKNGIRKASRHYGYSPSAISKWVKILNEFGHHPIPTQSSKPKSHPKQITNNLVSKIVDTRSSS
jgi:transposase-like protein